mmetsp:Transcript_445/g.1056  ORF Transcript_445/g.1056 Transcript_445/m.1056 type:complete len:308 (+) Transcript_445:353-1276(+)
MRRDNSSSARLVVSALSPAASRSATMSATAFVSKGRWSSTYRRYLRNTSSAENPDCERTARTSCGVSSSRRVGRYLLSFSMTPRFRATSRLRRVLGDNLCLTTFPTDHRNVPASTVSGRPKATCRAGLLRTAGGSLAAMLCVKLDLAASPAVASAPVAATPSSSASSASVAAFTFASSPAVAAASALASPSTVSLPSASLGVSSPSFCVDIPADPVEAPSVSSIFAASPALSPALASPAASPSFAARASAALARAASCAASIASSSCIASSKRDCVSDPAPLRPRAYMRTDSLLRRDDAKHDNDEHS